MELWVIGLGRLFIINLSIILLGMNSRKQSTIMILEMISIPKRAIVLHHTAGNSNPKSNVWSWNDRKYKIGTAFIIGGQDRLGRNSRNFDGDIYQAFREYFWSNHTGVRGVKNRSSRLEKETIAIEICSWGHLIKEGNTFYAKRTSFKKETQIRTDRFIYIPEEKVTDLGKEWRGFRYYHKYTDKQIAACKWLILHLAYFYNIDLPKTNYSSNWFEVNENALDLQEGLWTHVNFREVNDPKGLKTDCFPQPEFIEMLNSLNEEFKSFKPDPKVFLRPPMMKSSEEEMIFEDWEMPTDLDDIVPME